MDNKNEPIAGAKVNTTTTPAVKAVSNADKTIAKPKTVRTPRAATASKVVTKPTATVLTEQIPTAKKDSLAQAEQKTIAEVDLVTVTFADNFVDDSLAIEDLLSKKKFKKLKRTLAEVKQKEKNKKEKAKAKAKKASKKSKNKAKKEKAKKKKAAKKKGKSKKKSSSKKNKK